MRHRAKSQVIDDFIHSLTRKAAAQRIDIEEQEQQQQDGPNQADGEEIDRR